MGHWVSVVVFAPAARSARLTRSLGPSCRRSRAQPASEGPRPRAACEHGRVVKRRNSDGEQPWSYGCSTSSATASPPPRHRVAMPRLALRSAIA